MYAYGSFFGRGGERVHLVNWPYQPRMMDDDHDDEWSAVGGMVSRGNQSTQRKPAPMPLLSTTYPTWADPWPRPLSAPPPLSDFTSDISLGSFHILRPCSQIQFVAHFSRCSDWLRTERSSSPCRGQILLSVSSLHALAPTQSPQRVSGALFQRVKRPERQYDHSDVFSAEVKNTWDYTSTDPPPPMLRNGVVFS
jgi:hypothetical protein